MFQVRTYIYLVSSCCVGLYLTVRVYKYSPGHENCNRESSKKDKAWQVPLAIDLCSGPLTYAKLRH
jgi:hypothetical protein